MFPSSRIHEWNPTCTLALTMSLGTESRNLLILELEVDCPRRRCPWPSKTTCSRLESSFSWIQMRIVVGFTSTPERNDSLLENFKARRPNECLIFSHNVEERCLTNLIRLHQLPNDLRTLAASLWKRWGLTHQLLVLRYPAYLARNLIFHRMVFLFF